MPFDKKKIVYVISNINNSLGFEWLAEETDKVKYDLTFIFLNPVVSPLMTKFQQKGFSCYHLTFNGKKDIFFTIWKLVPLLRKINPAVVHCHLFEAAICGLTAAWITGVKKRIHTRHHSTLHHTYHPSVVKYDKWNNRLSTDIIAVSKVVKEVLTDLENVPAEKVTVIHHGFKLGDFYPENISESRVSVLREKYSTQLKKPIVGVVSRFVEWKGIQYIIPAFKDLLNKYPDAMLLMANAQGNYADEIHSQLETLPKGSWSCIQFENDIFALYRLFDMFIHVPVSRDAEAFGQIYIEVMAAGVPVICTASGIGVEVAADNVNAMLVPFRDSNAIYNKMMDLLHDPVKGATLIKNARNSIGDEFSVTQMIRRLEEVHG